MDTTIEQTQQRASLGHEGRTDQRDRPNGFQPSALVGHNSGISMARTLGWFSIGLGIACIATPGWIAIRISIDTKVKGPR
jgi:hypothetical protein